MEETPPTVAKTASVKVVSNLLRHYPTVLVSESGKLIGLITKLFLQRSKVWNTKYYCVLTINAYVLLYN